MATTRREPKPEKKKKKRNPFLVILKVIWTIIKVVVLTAIFPRGRGADDKGHAGARSRNDRTNALLKTFADGEKVVWLDLSDRLVDPETKWTAPEMFPDRIHPSDAVYRIWLSALAEVVDRAIAAEIGQPEARRNASPMRR